MKIYKIYLPALFATVLFLSGCGTTLSYLGDTYPANQNVEVFYDKHDIKRNYKVIGHITAEVIINEESIKQTMIGKVKLVGADGIIFNGLSFTGGKDSSPIEKADVIRFIDKDTKQKLR